MDEETRKMIAKLYAKVPHNELYDKLVAEAISNSEFITVKEADALIAEYWKK